MVIIAPYRPSVKPTPQVQPTNISGSVGTSIVTPINATTTSRTVVLESHFGGGDAGIEARFDWDFFNASGEVVDGNGNEANAVDAGTMNGWGATAITWDAGSEPDTRWGGNFALPLISGYENGYSEGWLTLDMKFSSNFSSPKGLKLPGLYPINNEPDNVDPFGCDQGFSIRQMLSGTAEGADALESHMYTYVNQNPRERDDWSGGAQVIEKNTVARVETYFKLNSTFDATDGILEQRYDVGTATTHATPSTIRQQLLNRYMYCGSEANRTNALIRKVTMNLFFGGANATWAPLTNSTLTLGYIKFETV